MTERNPIPTGTPCWADLWTSDVVGSARFYAELFGWEPMDPDPAYGGYFNFARQGAWIAGCMGDMGDMKATDVWKPYLAVDDMVATVRAAEAAGAQVMNPGMAVGDLGVQGVLLDPTGAGIGLWQAGTWPGFAVVGEPGAPSWFELHTRDFAGAVGFYRDVFGLEVDPVSDTEFRYATLCEHGKGAQLVGICDHSRILADSEVAHGAIYWELDDVDAGVTRVKALGGTVHAEAHSTPYGRIAAVADPAGATFMLRSAAT